MPDRSKLKPAQTRQLLQELQEFKTQFDPTSSRRKQTLIGRLSGAEFRDAKSLFQYHDSLCFLRAY
ncbi:MAG: hypothetical protein ABIJ61_04095, partial [bacterium]